MNIVIAGAGKVGYTIAERLCRENHDITLIDERIAPLEKAAGALDVLCVRGSCALPSILTAAEVGAADIFIAATGNDEANLVACQIARQLGAKYSIARLRNRGYLENVDYFRDIIGLNLTINPDYVTAEEISRMLQFPGATQVDSFPDCGLEIVTFRIAENSKLNGVRLNRLPMELKLKQKDKVLICCAERNGSFFIPDGDFVLSAGDRISVTAPPEALRKFFKAVSQSLKPTKEVMIVGGSRIAEYLTMLLDSTNVRVLILERDLERCDEMKEILRGADIYNVDGADPAILQEYGISGVDGFVALTNYDEHNIILGMYAEKSGVEKVVVKVNNDRFSESMGDVIPTSTLSPKLLVAERIDAYVRGLFKASDTSSIEALYFLGDRNVTATEFVVGEKAAVIGHTLAEMKLKPGVLLAAVVHGGRIILPDGRTKLQRGDRAVVVTTNQSIKTLDDILAGVSA